MRYFFHWLQAAADARTAAEPHGITYVDFLTVTLTAMCVLLAALGFIVAIVAVVGYRDIKSAAMKTGEQAAERALELKLREYPDAAEIHQKYTAMDRYMTDMLRKETLLSQVRATPLGVAKASKRDEDKLVSAPRPRRYPKKTE